MNKAKATFHYGLIQSSYWLSYLPIFAYGTAYLLNTGYSNVQIGTLFAAANLTSILMQSPLARGVDRQKIGMKSLMLMLSGMVLLMAGLIFLFSPLAIFYFIMLLSIMVLQPFVNSQLLERGAMAMLDYIEACPDGFRILSRDSSTGQATGSFASILSDIAARVEDLLAARFLERGLDPQFAPLYSQALVGLVAMTGQQWLDRREPSREAVARHLINLAWNGMANLQSSPELVTQTGASRRKPSRLEQGGFPAAD